MAKLKLSGNCITSLRKFLSRLGSKMYFITFVHLSYTKIVNNASGQLKGIFYNKLIIGYIHLVIPLVKIEVTSSPFNFTTLKIIRFTSCEFLVRN